MKFAVALFLLGISSTALADAGISVSYRSAPVIIEKNWLNDSKWPEENAYYEGIKTRRSLNIVSINLFLDDTVRGHDKKTKGEYVTKYFIREFEQPSDRYPVGRFIEKEVEIGEGGSEEDINMRNRYRWKSSESAIPEVYSKRVYKEPKLKGWLPGWLNPNRGAGYIFGVNFNYAAEDKLVEYYSWDMYIGKRLFLVPHLAHIYFKIGPSWARYNYDFVDRELFTETRIGGVVNLGVQAQVLKGVKAFVETEYRGYGSAPMGDSFNMEDSSTVFVNTVPSTDNIVWLRDLVTVGLRFGLKFTF